jgi:filamentous hemagglutinin family protein
MKMGLKSLFGAKPTPKVRVDEKDYIDLEELAAGSEFTDGTARMMVRAAEIRRYEDLREFANYVYQGNLLLLDFSPIEKDEIVLRRVTGDLKKLVQDINGDIAGLGKMFIITPTGVRVDRHKQTGGR